MTVGRESAFCADVVCSFVDLYKETLPASRLHALPAIVDHHYKILK